MPTISLLHTRIGKGRLSDSMICLLEDKANGISNLGVDPLWSVDKIWGRLPVSPWFGASDNDLNTVSRF
jgi:hypothetical protein